MTLRWLWLVALIACGGSAPRTAATPVATAKPISPAVPVPATRTGAQKIRTVEGITEYRLGNGLTVLLDPDPTQSTVTVNITYLVGSRFEGYGQTGMAHLLEHMMFKGSPRHRDVLSLIDALGGDGNGSTDYDRTNYYETLPASQANVDWALDLEADRMVHAAISPDDLASELHVVESELDTNENNPEGVLDERISEAAFLWHAYGKPTIGARSDIEHVPVGALRAFYTAYYQPDNAVLVVAGKFDDDVTLGSINATLGMIPKPSRVLTPSYTVEPVQDGERSVVLRRTGNVAAVGAAYHGPAGSAHDFAAFEAAIDILAREPSGRLYKKLVETKLATSLEGTAGAQHDPFIGEFFVEVRDPNNVDKVEQVLEAEIEGLGAAKLSAGELERWRRAQLKRFRLALADSTKVAVALSEYIALGDWRTLFAERAAIQAVTLADVERVAKAYFKRSNRTSGRFVPTATPDRAPASEVPNIADVVNGVETGAAPVVGERFDATLDTIEARTERTKLAGGLSAALLPKHTRGGTVHLELALHWGDATSLQNQRGPAALLGDLMMRGTTTKSYQDIRDLEDQLDATIEISSGVDGLTVEIETVSEHAAAALELAGELVTKPALASSELELVRQEQLATREQALQDPMTIALTALAQIITPWPKLDPRYPASPAEQIAELRRATAADVRGYYAKFAGASHGELTAVGDFDPKQLRAEADKLFGAWPSKAKYARLTDKVFGAAAQTTSIAIPDKEQTTIAFGFDFAMRDTDADYPAWLMVTQLLGGDTGSRLWVRLREHDGLSYDVQAWTSAGWDDDAASFDGYATVAPANVDKAKAALLDEISKLATGVVEPAELQRAKDAWLRAEDTSLSSDDYVVQLLARESFEGRTTEVAKQLRAKIAAVTPADVARVAKRVLDVKRISVIDAGSK